MRHFAATDAGSGQQPRAVTGLDIGVGIAYSRFEVDHQIVTERDEFVSGVQSVLKDAEIAVHNGDAGPRRAVWSQNEPVTVLGARKNAIGQQELDELFGHLAQSFSHCTSYELELLEAEVLGDAAYTVALEHTTASVEGAQRTYTLRATQIYRREGGGWKVAHRHGSAPPI